MCAAFGSEHRVKLVYFDAPGKAEAIRLAFHIAGIEFTDERLNKVTWAALKPTIGPYAQIPYLEVDDNRIFQSINIALYAGTITGLTVTDLLEECKMREAMLCCDDLFVTLMPSFSILDMEERVAARTLLFRDGGSTNTQMKKLELLVADKEYVAGNKLTVGDLVLFTCISLMQCGLFDGFPKDCLNAFPKLKKYHHRIASLPVIVAYYSTRTVFWTEGFRPSADFQG
jgi:prostaglandin-H2 D-isomerase / glutathione transferase